VIPDQAIISSMVHHAGVFACLREAAPAKAGGMHPTQKLDH
jgi:hypothetical protein